MFRLLLAQGAILMLSLSASADVFVPTGPERPGAFYPGYDERWYVIDGRDAEELYDFIPLKSRYLPQLDIEQEINACRPGEDNSGAGTGDAGGGGGQGSGPSCIHLDKGDVTVRDVLSYGLTCSKVKRDNSALCTIYSDVRPDKLQLPARVEFEPGKSNHIGRVLDGKTFRSSSGRVQLGCFTIRPGLYYDCYADLSQ